MIFFRTRSYPAAQPATSLCFTHSQYFVLSLVKLLHNIFEFSLCSAFLWPYTSKNIFGIVKFWRHENQGSYFLEQKQPSSKFLSCLVYETSSCITCRYDLAESVYQLLKRKVDPNRKTRDGRTALDFANSSHIIQELLRHGATPDLESWKYHLPANCPGNPAKLAVKTFVVGNPGTGKSTLTKSLQTENKGLFSVVNRVVKVAGVDEKNRWGHSSWHWQRKIWPTHIVRLCWPKGVLC